MDNSVNETGLGLDERDVLFFLTLSTVKYAKWSEIYLVTLKRNEVVFPGRLMVRLRIALGDTRNI